MNHETLEIDRQGACAWIWMNRADKHNAFDETLIAELTGALAALDADAEIRVVVLAGRGKSFSAGADMNWMKRQGASSVDDNLADARRLAELLRVLASMGKPTVARVQGAAIGGGMGLAAACHICVASETASFATSEVRLGLTPATISPYVLRAIGARQAYRYFQTAERIPAARAQAIGLVHEVAAPDALDSTVQRIVDALLAGSPQAQAACCDLILAVAGHPISTHVIEDTARRIAQIRATPSAQEGLSAFLDKRPARWPAPSRD